MNQFAFARFEFFLNIKKNDYLMIKIKQKIMKSKKFTNHFHLEDVSFGHAGSNQVLEDRLLVQAKWTGKIGTSWNELFKI